MYNRNRWKNYFNSILTQYITISIIGCWLVFFTVVILFKLTIFLLGFNDSQDGL